MSSDDLGITPADVASAGQDTALGVRTFRLILLMAQQMRTLMDQRLRPDGLTTQQAALLTIVSSFGEPTLSQVATAMATTHQNARKVADALQRKGFLDISVDPRDGRVRRLKTTAHHARFWASRNEGDHRAVVDWFAELSAAEAATLVELLTRVERRLREELAAADDAG